MNVRLFWPAGVWGLAFVVQRNPCACWTLKGICWCWVLELGFPSKDCPNGH